MGASHPLSRGWTGNQRYLNKDMWTCVHCGFWFHGSRMIRYTLGVWTHRGSVRTAPHCVLPVSLTSGCAEEAAGFRAGVTLVWTRAVAANGKRWVRFVSQLHWRNGRRCLLFVLEDGKNLFVAFSAQTAPPRFSIRSPEWSSALTCIDHALNFSKISSIKSSWKVSLHLIWLMFAGTDCH